ncbi:MAG: hypothetical protein ABI742_09015 [Gemmatimonadota bacterium]
MTGFSETTSTAGGPPRLRLAQARATAADRFRMYRGTALPLVAIRCTPRSLLGSTGE